MIVWIWDAPGQARAGTGIADTADRARVSAEAFMHAAQAPAARVEKATLNISRALTAVYIPTGHGWAAALAGGHVTWTPLRADVP